MSGTNETTSEGERDAKTHCHQIREALLNGRRLSRLGVLREFGCINLPGRIYDLRNNYFMNNIETEKEKSKSGKWVTYYFIDDNKGAAPSHHNPPKA